MNFATAFEIIELISLKVLDVLLFFWSDLEKYADKMNIN